MAFLLDGNHNHTAVTEFILLGLTDDPVLKVILFTIILCIYLVTVSGNLSSILLIRVSSQLHHPMYFFLSHLASVDIGYSSTVTPNMLVNFMLERSTTSYTGCGIQLGSADFIASVECFLLAAMACGPFMAICNPLLYSTKMSTQVCVQLILGSYVGGFLPSSSWLTFSLFSSLDQIESIIFFCNFDPLAELSCSDVSVSILISFLVASIVIITGFVIAFSYSYILITILKMCSTKGRHKAFSTCTSHLTAVTLYYGTITFIYVMPKSSYSTGQNKVASQFYMVVIPMLNLLIYSLSNNEIKGALKRQLDMKTFSYNNLLFYTTI